MRNDTLLYIRDIAHGLADLAEKNDLGLIARLYRMAEMETEQIEGLGLPPQVRHEAAQSRPAA